MVVRAITSLLLGLAAAGLPAAASAEERPELKGFKRIHGTAIERLVSGKEFGDGVHWRYSFQPGGSLTEFAMSRRQDLRWFVKDDALCWWSERGEDCFEVWTSSTSMRLHPRELGAPYEGTLSRLIR